MQMFHVHFWLKNFFSLFQTFFRFNVIEPFGASITIKKTRHSAVMTLSVTLLVILLNVVILNVIMLKAAFLLLNRRSMVQ
jgi:hypothetical protein